MRKLISIMLIIVMISSTIVLSVQAEGNTVEEATLIFDMDLSSSSNVVDQPVVEVKATAATQANISSIDLTQTGAINASNPKSTPIYREIDGKETPYLTFAELDEWDSATSKGTYTNYSSRVIVKMNEDIANKEKLTFETWLRNNNLSDVDGTKKVASFGKLNSDGKDFAFKLQWNHGALAMYADTGNYAASHRQPDCDKEWTHIVVTREWEKSETVNGDGKGKWKSVLYVNGVEQSTIYIVKDKDATYEKADFTSNESNLWKYLTIGGDSTNTPGQAFRGDISTFKVYDGILSKEKIDNAYYNTRGGYMDLVDFSAVHTSGQVFDITFEGEVKASSIAENMTIKRGSVEIDAVVTPGEEDADGNTTSATITVNDRLSYDEQYTIEVTKKLIDANGNTLSTLTKNVKTKSAPNGTVTVSGEKDDGTISANMPISGATQGEKFTISIAVFDSVGRMIDFKEQSGTAGEEGTASLSVSTDKATPDCTIEIITLKLDETKGGCPASQAITL